MIFIAFLGDTPSETPTYGFSITPYNSSNDKCVAHACTFYFAPLERINKEVVLWEIPDTFTPNLREPKIAKKV